MVAEVLAVVAVEMDVEVRVGVGVEEEAVVVEMVEAMVGEVGVVVVTVAVVEEEEVVVVVEGVKETVGDREVEEEETKVGVRDGDMVEINLHQVNEP